MKFFYIIFNIFCIIPFVLKGQDKLPQLAKSNVSDIRTYISANYSLKEKNRDTLCLYTTVFLKFKVSSFGKINEFSLSENIPDIIKIALEKAMKSSNSHWSTKKSDLEYFSKNTFILPIVLFYGRGCDGGDGELSLTVPVENWRKIYNTMRTANYAVLDILKFKEKSLDMLECVILAPLKIGDE